MKQQQLIDKYGRTLDYLRLSVTDRCNFRCYYCMPEEGVNFAPRKELLTFDEMYEISSLFVGWGIRKIRITGGEPFVRTGIISFLQRLVVLNGLEEITITTNGTLSDRHRSVLKELRIRKINISLDALDAGRFFRITRRDSFHQVYQGIIELLKDGFELKLNCVVAEGKNIEDIIPFVELTKEHALAIRFLEEMPFNGVEGNKQPFSWDYKRIYEYIIARYRQVIPLLNDKNSTSINYRVDGYQGTFGIIPSFSRTFCGTCNRIRLSATGELRTCLYGPPALNLREMIRVRMPGDILEQAIRNAVNLRAGNGFEAERLSGGQAHTSMSALGG
ncbi:GTP 3',8-cyclase MoaA [Mucilaginibacter sp. SG538B]|uniref:GTP 3',8-cyclase MoaA n=1 Tax=Mucilaginibacter sp. SG538B TaxID=2587021 RepID=UPI00159DF4BE|nr:GTP 3',8-cyclase MoaA [Mucilaginibacter sp. SG538B]